VQDAINRSASDEDICMLVAESVLAGIAADKVECARDERVRGDCV
jgi:hypothetical protein